MADSPIQDDLSASNDLLKNQQAFNKLLQEANRYRTTEVGDLTKEVNFLKSIGAYQQASAVHAKNMAQQQSNANELAEKYLDKFVKKNNFQKDEIKLIKEAAQKEADRLRTLSNYAEMLDKIETKHKKHIEDLRAQGSQIKANAKEWAKEKFGLKPEEGAGQKGEMLRGAAKGVSQAAQTGPEEMIKLLGPWGMLIMMLVGAADKVKKMGAQLQLASGATGEFGDGLKKFVDKAMGAELQFGSASDALFGQMGMTSEEIFKDAGELAAAGIKVANTIGSDGGMTEQFQDLEAIAAATGQSIGGIGKQFASIINTFRLGKTQAMSALTGVQNAAQGMLKTFSSTMPEVMGAIISVAEAAQSMGVTLQDTADLFTTLTMKLSGTKVSLADTTKIAGQLANIGKADKGWLAFMGKMGGGASGGFLGALGAAQQRGANFMGPGMNGKTLDMGAQVDMMLKAVNKATMGQSGAGKQFLKEQLFAQFGLDEQGAQAMNLLGSGKLSRAGAVKTMEKMKEETKFNKMGMKGILEVVENLMKKLIFAPIMLIYKIMSGSILFKGGASQTSESLQGSGEISSLRIAKRIQKKDSGGMAVDSGLAYIHSGETITPAAAAFRNTPPSHSSSADVNIAINVNMDERQLKQAFDKAHHKTLQVVRRIKQRAN